MSRIESPRGLETTLNMSLLFECYKKNGHENYVSKLFWFSFCVVLFFWGGGHLIQILLLWQETRMRSHTSSHIDENIDEKENRDIRTHCHYLDDVTLLLK